MMLRHPIASALAALVLGTNGAALAQSGSKSKPGRSAPLATVEAVQLSASVLRGGVSTPLAPGMDLGSRDQIRTGTQSRVLLRTADGSTVKLGAQGTFFLEDMNMRDDRVFQAAVKVAEGAFRFTTGPQQKFTGKREVSIAVNAVTAAIRGADLWGKSTSEGQILCLIEGRIEVSSPGERPFTMDEALSFYALEGEVSRAVATVRPSQFLEWVAETEMQPGRGVSKREGKWKIAVASAESHNDAVRIYEDLRRAGYFAEIVPANLNEKRVYGVRLSNFETKQDAEFVADNLKRQVRFARHDYKVGM